MPRVSIVMSEYNTPEEHLRAAIATILNQEFRDFELVLVDDGGTNDLDQILADYEDRRIRLLRNPTNLGLVESLRRGVVASKGEWIARTDTDDLYDPRHLANLVAAAETCPGFAVYSTPTIEFSDDSSAHVVGTPRTIGAREIVAGDKPSHPATLILRQAMLEVGNYPNFHRAEDFALWCEMVLAGHRILRISEPTHYQRVELKDYSKRSLKNRRGSMRAQLHYYPLLGAPWWKHYRVVRNFFLGVLPHRLVRQLRFFKRRKTSITLDLPPTELVG